ncbi:MAG: transcriptional regulator, ArsR family [Pelosinus sp.]|jgi:ArsR family transcriptional regulator|nr:transcriptional regulator, ArsR family [Pelosinus sp.]
MNREIQQFKADFFKALSHPLRINIMEILCEGDKNVNELQSLCGVEGAVISQQLAILRNKNIVKTRKEGTRVSYSLQDPMIRELMAIARQIFHNHLVHTIDKFDRFHKESKS